MSQEAVFVRDGERWRPTAMARGPWDPGALHGGATAALFVHALARCAPQPGLRLTRLTCEFTRPVPLEPLSVSAELRRPGRRVMLLEATARDQSGAEVARARALRVRDSELGEPDAQAPPFPGPDGGRANDFGDPGQPMFATHAMDIRFVQGAFRELGPATAWFRLRHPLVDGEPVAALERVAAAGDFGNGIASVLSWEEHTFINPDLTLYLEREPVGEWVAVQAQMRVIPGSVAVAQSVLWDERGRVGLATQALLVGRL